MKPRTLELRPEPGSLLKNRYRLIEDVNPANPGRIFHAQDTLTQMRVTVRTFLADPAILAQIDAEADRIKASVHPNFIRLFAIERERIISFIVLEWLEGCWERITRRRTGNLERNSRLPRCVPSDGAGLSFQGKRAWSLLSRLQTILTD